MFNLRSTEPRPVRYVRVDLPADGARCTGYLSQTDRRLRPGSRVTGVPGWGTVAVVDDPVTRHGVEHVPVAGPGWARTAGERTPGPAAPRAGGNASRPSEGEEARAEGPPWQVVFASGFHVVLARHDQAAAGWPSAFGPFALPDHAEEAAAGLRESGWQTEVVPAFGGDTVAELVEE